MSEHKQPKDAHTKVRSARSNVFQMPGPPGRPPQEVYGETSAVYVQDDQDIETLVQMLAGGREFVTKVSTDECKNVVFVRGVFPAKVSTLANKEG